jgi:UPF0716 protein FxsA
MPDNLSQVSIAWDSDTMNIHTIDCAPMRFGLLLFITIPIFEMYLLIVVGSHIGALPTIALVVLTATIGLWLLRMEGMATLMRLQERLNQGEIPGQELLEGVMLLVGGALLLTPGFFTDTIGFVCMLPGLRKPIAEWLIKRGMIGAIGSVHMGGAQTWSNTQTRSHQHKSGTTIDGEFEDQTPPHQRPPIDRD